MGDRVGSVRANAIDARSVREGGRKVGKNTSSPFAFPRDVRFFCPRARWFEKADDAARVFAVRGRRVDRTAYLLDVAGIEGAATLMTMRSSLCARETRLWRAFKSRGATRADGFQV